MDWENIQKIFSMIGGKPVEYVGVGAPVDINQASVTPWGEEVFCPKVSHCCVICIPLPPEREGGEWQKLTIHAQGGMARTDPAFAPRLGAWIVANIPAWIPVYIAGEMDDTQSAMRALGHDSIRTVLVGQLEGAGRAVVTALEWESRSVAERDMLLSGGAAGLEIRENPLVKQSENGKTVYAPAGYEPAILSGDAQPPRFTGGLARPGGRYQDKRDSPDSVTGDPSPRL